MAALMACNVSICELVWVVKVAVRAPMVEAAHPPTAVTIRAVAIAKACILLI